MNRKRRVVARLHPRCDEEAGLSCLSDMCGDILAGEPGSEHGGGLFGRERATCAASHYSAFRRCGIPRPSADCATPWACCQPAARWRIRRVSAGASPPLRRPTQSEGIYFPDCQSCLDAVINEAQSSGGFPRASILAKTVYGSFLLPEERSVDWSLTHA